MSMIDDGGPAFPAPSLGELHFGDAAAYSGMTLRDKFAEGAMKSLVARLGGDPCIGTNHDGLLTAVAKQAYAMADAMLAVRAVAAQKRAPDSPAVRHPVSAMCLAMSREVYRYEPVPDPRTTERGIAFLGRVLDGDLTSDEWDSLRERRGGCLCSMQGGSCHACTDEITDEEAARLLDDFFE